MADKQLSIRESLSGTHVIHQMLGDVLEELGGKDFLVNWAEDNPTAFVNILMRLAPLPQQQASGGGGGMHLHLHQDLVPGSLDAGPVTVENDET